MKTKYIVIIIFLIAILGSSSFLGFLMKGAREIRVKAEPESVVFLDPAAPSARVGETLSLTAMINTGANVVPAVELHLTYNPEVFQITSGGFTASSRMNEVYDGPEIDNANGTAYLVVGNVANPIQGTAPLASVDFNVIKPSEQIEEIGFSSQTRAGAWQEGGMNVVVEVRPAAVSISLPQPDSVLYFNPDAIGVSVGEEFDLKTMINTGTNIVPVADLYFDFNPDVFRVISLAAGPDLSTVYEGPVIDNQAGLASIVVGNVENPINGIGEIALLRLAVTADFGGEEKITFGSQSQVAAWYAEDLNVLKSTGEAKVTFVEPSSSVTFMLKLPGIEEARPRPGSVDLTLRQNSIVRYSFEEVAINTGADGVFSGQLTNIVPGVYDVLVKPWAHLRRSLGEVNFPDGEDSKDWTGEEILAGDSWPDNVIDIFDVTILSQNYGSRMPPEGSRADFNLDGQVDIFDLVHISENFSQRGDE
ncbi:MAG: hypothetical protein JW991_05505 [Candidatus Pacebacteria bacterium]|nr:hypothetical protein [Candidatus Paceibacterota bacterium]